MTENTASAGSTSAASVPTSSPGSEIDDQTHRKSPVASVTAPPAPPAPAPAGGANGTTGASPVKEGAVKAAAAALAAARSAAKKVQSAIPDGAPRTSETTDQPAGPSAGTAKRPPAPQEPRPQMHYSAGGVGGTAAPVGATGAVPTVPREAGPRRVRLSVSRVDPWSVMKLAFLLSVAIGFIIVIATMVVWYVLNDMGTFATIQDFLQQTVGPQTVNIVQFIAFDRIVSVAVLIAIVDIVLMTAIATIMAILYNVTAALVGGVHLTLTDE